MLTFSCESLIVSVVQPPPPPSSSLSTFTPNPVLLLKRAQLFSCATLFYYFIYIYMLHFLLRVPYVSNLVENRSEHVRCLIMFKSVIAV